MFEKIKNLVLYDIYDTDKEVEKVAPLMFGFIPMVVVPMIIFGVGLYMGNQ